MTIKALRPVSHVIFDVDGLLLDTETLYKMSIDMIVEQYNKVYDTPLRISVLGTKAMDSAKRIVAALDIPLSPEEFNKRVKVEQRKLLVNAALKPGAERLISHLSSHGIPIAVATSSNEENTSIKTANYKPLFSLFHHFVLGSSDPEVVHGKPAPDIFLIAAKRFPDNPPPENCLVFEDSPNGVEAGIAAGMQVVMVPEDFIPESFKTKATSVINSLLDFKPEDFGLPPFPNI
jgi:pseudouridine-5'-monophosphatase